MAVLPHHPIQPGAIRGVRPLPPSLDGLGLTDTQAATVARLARRGSVSAASLRWLPADLAARVVARLAGARGGERDTPSPDAIEAVESMGDASERAALQRAAHDYPSDPDYRGAYLSSASDAEVREYGQRHRRQLGRLGASLAENGRGALAKGEGVSNPLLAAARRLRGADGASGGGDAQVDGAVVVGPPPRPNRAEYPYVGTIDFQGLTILVETQRGGTRSGTDADGKPWSVTMPAHYGEFAATEGTDGDPVDAFVGPNGHAPFAYVIHLRDPATGEHDEDKVFVGFGTADDVRACFGAAYNRRDLKMGTVRKLPMGELRAWLAQRGGKKIEGGASLAKAVGALDAIAECEVPDWLGERLYAAQASDLAKGAGHKYLRRVPTGNPKRPWRYFYRVSGGAGLGHADEMKVGAAFKLDDDGTSGHFHIQAVDGDRVTIRHDETGAVHVVERRALVAMLHAHHATAIGEHRDQMGRDIAAAGKHGTAKQRARIAAEAARYEHTRHLGQGGGATAPVPSAPTPKHGEPGSRVTWQQHSKTLNRYIRRAGTVRDVLPDGKVVVIRHTGSSSTVSPGALSPANDSHFDEAAADSDALGAAQTGQAEGTAVKHHHAKPTDAQMQAIDGMLGRAGYRFRDDAIKAALGGLSVGGLNRSDASKVIDHLKAKLDAPVAPAAPSAKVLAFPARPQPAPAATPPVERDANGRRIGKPGDRLHYTGDMANQPRNGEIVSAVKSGEWGDRYVVRWDDGTESSVTHSMVARDFGDRGARFKWEDEDPRGPRSPEGIAEGKARAVADREKRDAEAAAEKKAHQEATAGWHPPADRGEAVKRIKAALEAAHPGGGWSVRGSSGTAYGWIHVDGDADALRALRREQHLGLDIISPDGRDDTLRRLEQHAGLFTPGKGHPAGSVAAKHKADADKVAAAKAEHGDATYHVGQVVTLHGTGRRYVVTGWTDHGNGRSYTARALSGSVKGSGPSGIRADVMAPHPDQQVEFSGAEASQRRAAALQEIATAGGDADQRAEARQAVMAGRAARAPAEVGPAGPPATAPQPADSLERAKAALASIPAPAPAAGGAHPPVAFIGEVVEGTTQKRGNKVWSVPHTGSIPPEQFAAMKADAEAVKGYHLRGQGFTFRDPAHARDFAARWGAGGTPVAPAVAPQAAVQPAPPAPPPAAPKPSAWDAAAGAGESWRQKRAENAGVEGRRADVKVTPAAGGSHKHRLVIDGKDRGEHYLGDARRIAAETASEGQAIRNRDRNAAAAVAARAKLGLDPANAPAPVPEKIQPTRQESAEAMTARHAAEVAAIDAGDGKILDKMKARDAAKVRHEVEAFEAGHKWQDPREVQQALDRARQRGFNTYGGKRELGYKHHGVEHLRAALPAIMGRHRAHQEAQAARARATGSAEARLSKLYHHLAGGGAWRTDAPDVGEVVTHRNDTLEVARVGGRNARVTAHGAPDGSGHLRGHHELGMPHREAMDAVISTASDDDLAAIAAADPARGGIQAKTHQGPYGFGVAHAAAEVERRKAAGTWRPSQAAPAPRALAEVHQAMQAHRDGRKAQREADADRKDARAVVARADLARRAASQAAPVSTPRRTDAQKHAAAIEAVGGSGASVDHHEGNVTVVRKDHRGVGPSWSVVEHHDDGTTTEHRDGSTEKRRDARAYAEDLRAVHARAGKPTREHLQTAADLDHVAEHIGHASFEVPEHLRHQYETPDRSHDGVVRADTWTTTSGMPGHDPHGAERSRDSQRMREIAGQLRGGHANVDARGSHRWGTGGGQLAGMEGGYATSREKARERAERDPPAYAEHDRAPRAVDRDSLTAEAAHLTGKWRAIMAGKTHATDTSDSANAARTASGSAVQQAWNNGYTFERGAWRDGDEAALYNLDQNAGHRQKAAVESLRAAGVRPVPHGHFPTRESGPAAKLLPAPRAGSSPLAKAFVRASGPLRPLDALVQRARAARGLAA